MQAATPDNARLCELFGGRDRFRLLRALYLAPQRAFSNSELAQLVQVDRGNAHKWLTRWADLGLVRCDRDGRNIRYRASDDPLFVGLSAMMLRSDALIADIRAALPPEADSAVVFGSAARGDEHASSDVDVLVLGPALSSIAVNAALLPVGRNHQRTIRASVMSPAEFDALLAGQDSFATALVSRPMIVVKGSFDHGRPDAGADCNPGAEARSA